MQRDIQLARRLRGQWYLVSLLLEQFVHQLTCSSRHKIVFYCCSELIRLTIGSISLSLHTRDTYRCISTEMLHYFYEAIPYTITFLHAN